MRGEDKTIEEKGVECFIIQKTVAGTTTGTRLFKGDYRKYLTSLVADPDNGAGLVYVGLNAENCTFPLNANAAQITKVNLDLLFFRSTNGTEKVNVWAERL